MKLLCIDGLDPDLMREYGWNSLFRYNYKLEIPRECFVPDPELGSTPHTTRVWPTIFSGEIIDYGAIRREGFRKVLHDLLVKNRVTWNRSKPKYRVRPVNEDLDTILDHCKSFHWNIPTISPEWISTFPSYEAFVRYCKRELRQWISIVFGSRVMTYQMEAYYTRYVDFVGHNDYKNLEDAYHLVLMNVETWKKHSEVIVLSDHGCVDGLHTNYAYLGSDRKFMALSVEEIRDDLERLLRNAGAKRKD